MFLKLTHKYLLIGKLVILILPLLLLFSSGSPYSLFALPLYLYLALAYFIFFILRRQGVVFPVTEKTTLLSLALFFTLTGAIAMFVSNFSYSEHFIYTWEHFIYWRKSIAFSSLYFSNVSHAFSEWHHSILTDMANYTPTLFIAPFLKILGKDYSTYILSLFFVYYLPAICLYALLFFQMTKEKRTFTFFEIALLCLTCLLFTPFLSPVLYGYMDVSGLPFMAFFLLLASQKGKQPISSFLLIGIVLLFLFFLVGNPRYIPWSLCYFLSGSLVYAPQFLLNKQTSQPQSLRPSLGFLSLFLVLVFASAVFLWRNFSPIWFSQHAWRSSPSWNVLMDVWYFLGPFPCLLTFVGLVYSISQSSIRRFSFFCAVHLVLFLLYASFLSTIGITEYLSIGTLSILFCKWGIDAVGNFVTSYFTSFLLRTVIVLFLFLNFLSTYQAGTLKSFSPFSFLFAQKTFYPRQRQDLEEVKRLENYLEMITACSRRKIYAIGSSTTFNDWVIRNVKMPKEYNPIHNLLPAKDVDARDGFAKEALEADFIVLGWPLQYHLHPEEQKNVVRIGQMVKNNCGEGKSYRLLKTFHLDNQVQALVLEKVAPIPQDTLKALQAAYSEQRVSRARFWSFK